MPHCFPTVESLDLNRYSGVWWEFARSKCIPYEKDCYGARAEYCYIPEKKCFKIKNTCYDCEGRCIRESKGILTGTCNGGKYKVKFEGQKECGDYWVHWTDYDRFAIVGSSDRNYVWILSRSKRVSREDGAILFKLAKEYGYHPKTIIFNRRNIINARSKVRFVHNIFEGPNVDIYINGDQIIGGFEYSRSSEYMDLPAENTFIEVKSQGGKSAIIYCDMEFKMDVNYTVVICGTVQAEDGCPIVHMMTLEDDNSCPMPCTSRVRFVHSDADIKALDVWINEEPKIMATEYPLMKRGSYNHCNNFEYVSIKSGPTLLQLKMKGSDVKIFEVELNMEEQKVYTLMPSGMWNADPSSQDFVLLPLMGLDFCTCKY